MFFMRIFHQRHENRLHVRIARVLFVRLSWSKVQGIPETFFVTYHQETIVKSSQYFTKYGAKHTQGSSTGKLSPSMSELPGYKQHRRGFFKNETTSSKEYGQKRYSLHRRLLHIEKRKFHGRQKFPDVVRMISI